jgi:diguanylate cyclase (GGDEF)-like protein
MGRSGSFLCPTELDRARVVEASARVRVARTISAAAMGTALLIAAPWEGWWTLGLFALVALNLATLEPRLRRTHRPENVAAQSLIFILIVIAVGIALSGGPESPVLAWAILPSAMAATRFRWQVVCAGAGLTAIALLTATLAVDPRAVADDPTELLATLALLVSVTSVTSALMHGELIHRDRAVLDPLTGLLNRAALEARAREIDEQARLTGGSVSILLIDLDGFKRVNDTHGHERGDVVLREVAYEIRKSLRSFELVYRLGGEEFLVLLPGVELGGAVEIAERIRRAVASARPGDLELTLSAGVATTAGGRLSYEELFRAADGALFAAKRAGRDRVEVAGAMPPLLISDARRFEPDGTAAQLG